MPEGHNNSNQEGGYPEECVWVLALSTYHYISYLLDRPCRARGLAPKGLSRYEFFDQLSDHLSVDFKITPESARVMCGKSRCSIGCHFEV